MDLKPVRLEFDCKVEQHRGAGLSVWLVLNPENPGAPIRPIIRVWGQERAPPAWLSGAAAGHIDHPDRLAQLLHELQAARTCGCISHAEHVEHLSSMVRQGKLAAHDYQETHLPHTGYHVCHAATCGYWVDPMAIRSERCPGCRDLARLAQAFARTGRADMTLQQLMAADPDTLTSDQLRTAMKV